MLLEVLVLAVLSFLFSVPKPLRFGWTARPKSLSIGVGFGCLVRPSSFWHDPIVLSPVVSNF